MMTVEWLYHRLIIIIIIVIIVTIIIVTHRDDGDNVEIARCDALEMW